LSYFDFLLLTFVASTSANNPVATIREMTINVSSAT